MVDGMMMHKLQGLVVLDPDLSKDYLDRIQNRTKERRYSFDHVFGPECTNGVCLLHIKFTMFKISIISSFECISFYFYLFINSLRVVKNLFIEQIQSYALSSNINSYMSLETLVIPLVILQLIFVFKVLSACDFFQMNAGHFCFNDFKGENG